MIIKNNFNKNSVEPLSDYESIRKNCDDNVNKENRKKARRLEKKVMHDVLKNNDTLTETEEEEDNSWDNWHF